MTSSSSLTMSMNSCMHPPWELVRRWRRRKGSLRWLLPDRRCRMRLWWSRRAIIGTCRCGQRSRRPLQRQRRLAKLDNEAVPHSKLVKLAIGHCHRNGHLLADGSLDPMSGRCRRGRCLCLGDGRRTCPRPSASCSITSLTTCRFFSELFETLKCCFHFS
jgi:hypothetical protein